MVGAIGVILWRLFDEEEASARVRHHELLAAASVIVLGGALGLLGVALFIFGP